MLTVAIVVVVISIAIRGVLVALSVGSATWHVFVFQSEFKKSKSKSLLKLCPAPISEKLRLTTPSFRPRCSPQSLRRFFLSKEKFCPIKHPVVQVKGKVLVAVFEKMLEYSDKFSRELSTSAS